MINLTGVMPPHTIVEPEARTTPPRILLPPRARSLLLCETWAG